MSGDYEPPRPIEPSDDLDSFECRSSEQTSWLLQHARQSSAAGTTRVFVVTPVDSATVVAYYGWCMASVNLSQAPPQLRQGSANYPQPVALLARLGVDTRHEGRGLGAALLADVLARLVRIAVDIGCRGLLIHSETYEARDFYVHNVPELESSPTAELHLYLLMKHARRAVAATKAR